MSVINEYLSSNAKARAQEILDSFEKSLTVMVGVVSIGPIALFVLSTVINPYLVLLIPIFITMTVITTRRLFTILRGRLNQELIRSMGVKDEFINEVLDGGGSVLMSVLGINDFRKWFYVLRALRDEDHDLLDFLLSREMRGDLSMREVELVRHLLAIRFSSDKLTISALGRGLRTIMLGYYILLFAIPTVAKSLQFLGVHWNILFVLITQVLISTALLTLVRIMRREFNVKANAKVLFTVIFASILMSIILLVR